MREEKRPTARPESLGSSLHLRALVLRTNDKNDLLLACRYEETPTNTPQKITLNTLNLVDLDWKAFGLSSSHCYKR